MVGIHVFMTVNTCVSNIKEASMINAESFSQGLKIPFVLPINLKSMIANFQLLIEEPHSYRLPWAIQLFGEGEPETGLVEKIADTKSSDQKWFLHYKPRLLDNLIERRITFARHGGLLRQCHCLYNALAETAERQLIELDHQFPELDIQRRLTQWPEAERYILRLLFYKTGTPVLAHPHVDRSFMTFHVAESHPGLILGEKATAYETRMDTVLAFPGIKAALLTNDLIPAMKHAVIATNNDPRWAIVFFTHLDIGVSEEDLKELTLAEMPNLPVPA